MGQLMKLFSFSQLASPSQFKNCYHSVEIAAIKRVTPQLRPWGGEGFVSYSSWVI
jgi:hypothetical protein